MVSLRLLIIMTALICPLLNASLLSVTHIRPDGDLDTRNAYFIDLLDLALKKTQATDGGFELKQSPIEMNQARAMRDLENNNNIDLVWTMTSIDRESKLRPIRIPLLKGLLGYRVFIIRKGEQNKFSKITHLEQLQAMSAGQGASWPDTEILKANGFSLIEASEYKNLFAMLENGRFDYFPRGVNEAWTEVKAHSDEGFTVEKSLLLQYPAPIYFFVNKENEALANRLEKGLELAIEDGSFERIFRQHPANKLMFEAINISNRHLFKLTNPLLPLQTPLHDHRLWYQVN